MPKECGFGRYHRSVLALSISALALAAGSPATAQTAPAQTLTASPEDQAPGDIVVTATRRSERLQDVPVSVTAVSAETLRATAFTDISDLRYVVPGISFTGSAPFANSGGFVIRGVGTQASNYATEQTVGTVVDGVVIGMPRDPGVTGFSDIDRVEVLRGPQGTLFGKNSSAGVVSIITKKPELGVASFDGHAKYGSRNDALAQGNLNLGLSSAMALRISSFYQSQEGAIPNEFADWHVGDHKSYGVRSKLLYEPSDNFSVLLIGEYQHLFSRDPYVLARFGSNTGFASLFAPYNADPTKHLVSYQNEPWTAKSDVYGFSAQIDYKLGDFTLTSISAYRNFKLDQQADLDAAPINLFDYSSTINHDRQVTQELRLTSPSEGRLQYVVGAFYYDVHIRADETQYGAFGGPVLLSFTGGGTNHYDVTTRSAALFGQATFNVDDKLKFIGGLRYTHDFVRAGIGLTIIPGLIPTNTTTVTTGRVKEDNLSGKAGIQYEFSRDVMAYATFARGYKGPAINIIQGTAQPLKPELSDSYEIGIKSSLFDRRVTVNASLFSETFKDFQAQAFDMTTVPFQLTLLNAGRLRSRGGELEINGRATRNLTLSASVAYADAKFREFTTSCYDGEPISGKTGVGCYAVPGGTAANRAGSRLPNSPEWTYTLTAAYESPVVYGYRVSANANWAWQSTILNPDLSPANATKSYGLLNGAVGLSPENRAWKVGVYARNLLNKHYYAPTSSFFDPGGQNVFVGANAYRTIGASFDVRF